MSDIFVTVGRVLMLVHVPLMLLFPLVFVMLVPGRNLSDAARLAVRGRVLLLALVTVMLLGIWAGLLIASIRVPSLKPVSHFWWMWFFPLWFLLAWPIAMLKRPHWASQGISGRIVEDFRYPMDEVRTASLVNRERTSPVTRSMWIIMVAVVVLAVGAIAARGLFPFPLEPLSGVNEGEAGGVSAVANQDSATERTEEGNAQFAAWVRTLVIVICVFGCSSFLLPTTIRRLLTEPEPMDQSGSPDLRQLYEQQRNRRALGLFWGCGVLLPAVLGLMFGLAVWMPEMGSVWGLVGGVGGTLIGLLGAGFGIWMTVERMKIAERRARLDNVAPGSLPGTAK